MLRSAFLVLFLCLVACGPAVRGKVDPASLTPSRVGRPVAAAVKTMVGPMGGTLATSDGSFKVTIPAGALAAMKELSLQPITATAPGAAGRAYRLGPEGTTFSSPVTLAFTLSEDAVAGQAPSDVRIATQNSKGFWQVFDSTFDASTRVVTTKTTHFSDWSPVVGSQILIRNSVSIVKRTVGLSFQVCVPVDASALPSCQPELGPCNIAVCSEGAGPGDEGWFVNDVKGGSQATGLIRGQGSRVTFVSPDNIPSPDTVNVSYRFSFDTDIGKRSGTAKGTVKIIDPQVGGVASFSNAGLGIYSGSADLFFTLSEEQADVYTLKLQSALFTVDVKVQNCDVFTGVRTTVLPSAPGSMVLFNEVSEAGKVFFWDAAGLEKDIMLQCGTPRRATPFTVALSFSVPELPYEVFEDLSGDVTGPDGTRTTFAFEPGFKPPTLP